MKRYTAVSLFSGIGGIDLAFTWAGFNIIAQVEIDKYCRRVLAKHAPRYWPDAFQLEDIKNASKENLPRSDVLFGGFPCTDISVAGKQAGITTETRSGLWFEFARLIGELRPRIVFLENVPPITSNGGTIVISQLASMGYDAEWCVIPATAVGAPHRRERWYCVAYTANGWIDRRIGIKGDDATGSQQRGIHRGDGTYGRAEVVGDSCSIRQLCTMGKGRSDIPNGQWNPSPDQQIRGEREFGVGEIGIVDDSRRARLEGCSECESQFSPTAQSGEGYRWESQTQSGVGRIFDGLPQRLDEFRQLNKFPAPPDKPQYEWESPRVIETKGKHYKDRIKALGNSVLPQVVYPFARIIRTLLEKEDGLI